MLPRHRGRFAPSPSGQLHLGNARSALLGWLWARRDGGEFLLRIEDLDPARSRPEHVQTLREDLAYLSLDFDGEVLMQSTRSALYNAALEELARQDLVYPCFCTRTEVARAAVAPHGLAEEGPRYPGTCSGLGARQRSERALTRTAALRFRTPPGVVSFTDAVEGVCSQDVRETVGDFVVRRNDGVASYQLAVVVDDHASAITHVLRGDDLLASTARQLLLYSALGHAPPQFAHVGLLVGPDGKRMAKREGSTTLAGLRAGGTPAERVVGLLASWSSLGEGGPSSAAALIPGFSLARVPHGPVVVTEASVRAGLNLAAG